MDNVSIYPDTHVYPDIYVSIYSKYDKDDRDDVTIMIPEYDNGRIIIGYNPFTLNQEDGGYKIKYEGKSPVYLHCNYTMEVVVPVGIIYDKIAPRGLSMKMPYTDKWLSIEIAAAYIFNLYKSIPKYDPVSCSSSIIPTKDCIYFFFEVTPTTFTTSDGKIVSPKRGDDIHVKTICFNRVDYSHNLFTDPSECESTILLRLTLVDAIVLTKDLDTID